MSETFSGFRRDRIDAFERIRVSDQVVSVALFAPDSVRASLGETGSRDEILVTADFSGVVNVYSMTKQQ